MLEFNCQNLLDLVYHLHNVADMQEINAEYDRLFKILKNKHESKQTKTNGTKTDFNSNYWNYEEDKAIQKKQWYWFAGGTFRKKSNKPLSMDDIRSYYGSTEVRPEERLRLKQA